MAVKIRLKRRGRKKLALYDIVVADARAPRDGRFIEKLGNYNPHTHPATIVLAEDSALRWLLNGAQPTHTARNILSRQGVLLRKHLQVGVQKGAITQEDADKKWEAWKQEKESGALKTTKAAAPAGKKKSEQSKASPEASASEQVQETQGSPVTESPKEVRASAPEQPPAAQEPSATESPEEEASAASEQPQEVKESPEEEASAAPEQPQEVKES